MKNPIMLRQEAAAMFAEATKLLALVQARGETARMTADENNKINELVDKQGELLREAETIDKFNAAENAARQPASAIAAVGSRVTRTIRQRGEFLQAIAAGREPVRLVGEDWSGEYSDGAGAQLIPIDVRREILGYVFEPSGFLSTIFTVPTASNTVEWTTDADYDFQFATGIKPDWSTECTMTAAGMLNLGSKTLTLRDCDGLCKISNNQLDDAPLTATIVTNHLANKIRFRLENAVLNGAVDATANPKGILTAACAKSVAKETAQVAGTIVTANIMKMYGSMPPSARGRAIWIVNQQVPTLLGGMTLGTNPIYLPPGGIAEAPLARLMGRPVYESLYSPAPGTVGDIAFVDPVGGYVLVTKSNGLRLDSSIHAYYDKKQTAFRGTLRVDGAPTLAAAIALPDSSTVSPIVKLATRA